jgi:D-alanyl-D-alanine carboxypeptidase
MTARREHRHQQQTRRLVAGVLGAALALGGAVAGTQAPAAAAATVAGQSWSALMYRSLTAGATAAQLRTTLATQQQDVAARAAAITAATAADTAAQAQLRTAAGADATVRAQYAASATALGTAKASLARLQQQKPRPAAAIANTQKFVTAATTTVSARLRAVTAAAATLKAAQARAIGTGTAAIAAAADWRAATAAVTLTQQKISTMSAAGTLASQAAAVSRDVVAQVRPTFTTADTTTVYGVTVNRIVAYPFQRMMDDAKAAGIPLSGGGFRTKERQIELRTINGCPDVWTAPASSCRVPTAIPGRSLHELGLAVDITVNGRTVAAKTPAFAWLTAHAGAYGFVNLPSEAWHWSITGG